MEINGKNYLLLEKRGCNFWDDDEISKLSDCGNYRIGCYYDLVPGVDGNKYCFEFGGYDKKAYKKTNKRTGEPLNKPVIELVRKNALHIDSEFENECGSWRNCKLEEEAQKAGYNYTLADILKFVNSVSTVKYDGIKFIHAFDNIKIESGANFTPSTLIHEYCAAHNLEEKNGAYFEKTVKLYSGEYKYMAYEVKPGNGCDLVTIYLEEVV